MSSAVVTKIGCFKVLLRGTCCPLQEEVSRTEAFKEAFKPYDIMQ